MSSRYMFGQEPARSARGNGPKPWPVVALSVLGSAGAVAAVGFLCALIYPILKELRAERVTGEDGTEEKMLGFWSLLVLSVLVGCICCVFSWMLTYLDSFQPGMDFPTLRTVAHVRDASDRGFHVGYGVAVLNGIMAMLTIIWSLC
ncbi:ADP-ribosylation factor-like protein 6-interacting protein 6 [Simochromis diagramma]|uniref:ADP-ribosylation factor-like protein 6-interacting protein 6 n=1 Tax=Simochromis diagramma TaxID=43689 RepID=UPI001A7E319F|nr:ADP-ribosylation factor-like protein 6-interacting protein 6 isoform X1 [Simochromis diagramma]XP_039870796.1 ADP-ribosylation factor-like protein 6-interacting protein 6 [Simochromis diagramma]